MAALDRPGIMLFGARRSGKTSIAKVVFGKMPQHETLFLQPSTTTRVYTIATNPYMQFAVWDWPGGYEFSKGSSGGGGGGGAPGTSLLSSSPFLPPGSVGVDSSLTRSYGGVVSSMSSARGGGGGGGRGSSVASAPLSAPVRVIVYEDPQDEDADAEGAAAAAAAAPDVEGIGAALAGGGGGAAGGGVDDGSYAPAGTSQTLTEFEALSACSAIIFVIDAADEPYTEAFDALRHLASGLLALARRKAAAAAVARAAGPVPLTGTLGGAAAAAPSSTGIPGSTPSNPYGLPSLEVFVHKVDTETFPNAGPEMRTELLRDVGLQVATELADAGFAVAGLPGTHHGGGGGGAAGGPGGGISRGASAASGGLAGGDIVGPVQLPVSFHMTSIQDSTVFEAMSRVVQKVTPGPQLMPSTENLLNSLQLAISAEKVFLFDIVTKLYFATDSNPVQESTYELCADMLEVVVDVSCIYDPLAAAEAAAAGGAAHVDVPKHVREAADAGRCSTSLIKLTNGSALYMREVAPFLAVVALVKDDGSAMAGSADAAAEAAEAAASADDGDFLHAGGAPVRGGDDVAAGDADAFGMGGAGGTLGMELGMLPRSGLALPNRALIDYNIRVFARALAELFSLKFGIASTASSGAGAAGAAGGSAASASGGVTIPSGARAPAGSGGGGVMSPVGSYAGGGLPMSSSLSRSFGGGGGLMSMMGGGGRGGGGAGGMGGAGEMELGSPSKSLRAAGGADLMAAMHHGGGRR